jgi:hypothetical protein
MIFVQLKADFRLTDTPELGKKYDGGSVKADLLVNNICRPHWRITRTRERERAVNLTLSLQFRTTYAGNIRSGEHALTQGLQLVCWVDDPVLV